MRGIVETDKIDVKGKMRVFDSFCKNEELNKLHNIGLVCNVFGHNFWDCESKSEVLFHS